MKIIQFIKNLFKKNEAQNYETLTIAGQKLVIHPTYETMCRTETLAGKSFPDILSMGEHSATKWLLYASLKDRQPRITPFAVSNLLGAYVKDGGILDDIVAVCAKGMRAEGLLKNNTGK
jgi:hypothetical protein